MKYRLGFLPTSVLGPISRRLLLLSICLLSSCAFPARAEIVLLDGNRSAIAELPIGSSLAVTLLDLEPGAGYGLTLVDAMGLTLASASAQTDAFGNIGPVPLWGGPVVGCDSGAPSGLPYHFTTRGEAETALAGQTLFVELRHASGGSVLEAQPVPLVVGAELVVTPVDAAGCARYRLAEGESLWLEIDRAQPGEEFHLWILDLTEEIRLGMPLRDPRGVSEATTIFADAAGRLSVEIWPAPTAGVYGFVLMAEPTSLTLGPEDLAIVPSIHTGGTCGVHVEDPVLTVPTIPLANCP